MTATPTSADVTPVLAEPPRRHPWLLGRRPGLDGLRGLAVLLVIVCHLLDQFVALHRFHTIGATGVAVFFTLSGFLITSLLIEGPRGGGVRPLGRFYRNRVLRLFPALFVATIVLGVLQVVIGWGTPGAVVPVLFYYVNWSIIAHAPASLFLPMWSLSIEEQFYLVWPLLFLITRRWRNGPLITVFVGILVSTVLRFVLWDGGAGATRVYFGSDTQSSTLLVGCLLAILVHRGMHPLRAPWVLPVGLGLLCASVLVTSDGFGELWVPTLVPWLTAALIWAACHQRSVLNAPVLQSIGRRSYALYLWHCAFIWLTAAYIGTSLVWGFAAVVATFFVAQLSYRYVETPFLRRKTHRDRPRSTTATLPPVVVAPTLPLDTPEDHLEPLVAEPAPRPPAAPGTQAG